MQNNQVQTVNRVGKKVGKYVFTRILGRGSFAEVFEASNEENIAQRVAIKCVLRSRLSEHRGLVNELLKTEVEILRKCHNPNVIKLFDYFESVNQCYLVLEYCNGDFEQLWKSRNRMIPENEAISYLKQILNGIKGLHELRVIHRDLKLANLLIHDGQIKIADLGFAKQLDSQDQKLNLTLGSLGCMAPEVVEGKMYGIIADMWSLGSIFYQMLFGEFPFSVKSHQEFLNDITNRRVPNFNVRNIRVSDKAKDLLTRMLAKDPSQRIKWIDIYEHSLINERIGANNEIQLHNILSQMVDPRANRQVYLNDQDQLESLQNQVVRNGTTNGIREQTIKIQELVPEQIASQATTTIEQDDPEFMKQIQQIINMQVEMEQQVMNVLKKYFTRRNMYVFLAKTYDLYQHTNKENLVYIVYTELMLLKKLCQEAKLLVQNIGEKKNIFNVDQEVFKCLYTKYEFIVLFEIVQEDLQTYNTNLEYHLSQQKQYQGFIGNLTSIQIKELDMEITSRFDDILRNSVVDYYFEKNQIIADLQNIQQKQKMMLLIYLMQERILFPNRLEQKMMADQSHSFDSLVYELENMPLKQLETEINQQLDQM